MICKVVLTAQARRMLTAIADRRAQRKIAGRIDSLAEEPEKQGKPLLKELAGLRSIRAAGRYRVIYQVDRKESRVVVLVVGLRKSGDKADVYSLARRLLRLRLL